MEINIRLQTTDNDGHPIAHLSALDTAILLAIASVNGQRGSTSLIINGNVKVEGSSVGDVSHFTAETVGQSAEYLASLESSLHDGTDVGAVKSAETPPATTRTRKKRTDTTEVLPAADVAAAQAEMMAEVLGAPGALPPPPPAGAAVSATASTSLPPLGEPAAVTAVETLPLPPAASSAPPPGLPGSTGSLPVLPQNGVMTLPDFQALSSHIARKKFKELFAFMVGLGFQNPQAVPEEKRTEVAQQLVMQFELVAGQDFNFG